VVCSLGILSAIGIIPGTIILWIIHILSFRTLFRFECFLAIPSRDSCLSLDYLLRNCYCCGVAGGGGGGGDGGGGGGGCGGDGGGGC
jgi:hypothetical protein